MNQSTIRRTTLIAAASLFIPTVTRAADQPRVPPPLAAKASAAIDKAIKYYEGVQQEDGSFTQGSYGLGVTSLAVAGMLRTKHVTPKTPMIAKALKYIESNIQPDGGIYASDIHRNYFTSVGLMALAEANRNGQYKTAVDNAVKYLQKEQYTSAKVPTTDPRCGGWDYGNGKGRADLSNSSLVIEALADAGVGPESETFKEAILFLRRSQNFKGEGGNDQAKGADVDMDGGHFYSAIERAAGGPQKGEGKKKADDKGDAKKGDDKAAQKRPIFPQKTPTGGIPSYGSMTTAGIRSYLTCGVGKNDPRTKAGLEWVRKHYTLDENPGRGKGGLYYYYHTLSQALSEAGIDEVTDANGASHQWRTEMVESILAKQRPDGGWFNDERMWMENEPRVVTAYVLIALDNAVRRGPKN